MDSIKSKLDAVRAVEQGATEGPWAEGAVWDDKHKVTTQCVLTEPVDPNDTEEICLSGDLGDQVKESENMTFIALSRTAVPALLDAVERQLKWMGTLCCDVTNNLCGRQRWKPCQCEHCQTWRLHHEILHDALDGLEVGG
jgi:hypothetical protein